jgi:hypothetical protein
VGCGSSACCLSYTLIVVLPSCVQAIIELRTGITVPAPLEWPFTNETNEEQDKRTRLSMFHVVARYAAHATQASSAVFESYLSLLCVSTLFAGSFDAYPLTASYASSELLISFRGRSPGSGRTR